MKRIYLDNAATTSVSNEVITEMFDIKSFSGDDIIIITLHIQPLPFYG